MMKNQFLIVGSGGRESAFALRLIEDTILYAAMDHANPTIVECTQKSGGEYSIVNTKDPMAILRFAQQNHIDYAFVSADDPLANGVVDTLLEHGIKAIGGTRDATRIEWDKIYSINLMQKVCPQFTPQYEVVSTEADILGKIDVFSQKNQAIVVKPQGLTGGKGVKVMPQHLKTYEDCAEYIRKLLQDRPGEKVLLVEKLEGIEFTIMGFTDGENLVLSPASYDYPYRFAGDQGAGTGGMGCFTSGEKTLPFMNSQDLVDCEQIMQAVIDELSARKLSFNGVLNGGFFKTSAGIRFMEFNSRFGDPEGLNILALLRGSFSELLKSLYDKTLSEDKVAFIDKASVIKYLVAPEYPEPSQEALGFTVNQSEIESMGVKVFFAACVGAGEHQYKTIKKSRVLALGALADQIEDASQLVNQAIEQFITGPLEFRADIGSKENLEELAHQARLFHQVS